MSSRFMEQVNRTPLTFLLLLAYLTLAFVTGLQNPDMAKLMAFGAARGANVQNGEIWRLLAYAFLHGGLLHLAFNSYFLYFIGPPLEHAMGTKRFALVYVISAVGGGMDNVNNSDPTVKGVGSET